ncbi:SDR family oxidoreductase [Vibrio salinus]|uniref:SDR family oxidoreductase n=1 Tax=Vibrio salinus TaxID=2899784 RepID=UPI001E4E5FA4|nr:SDR family NAD(P)-dependent oxidoreductase [Vibrio salinus]MCE0494784.1 SDR family oxidoreductase [Vibrio salinus]
MGKLKNRNFMVTGATSGIGKKLAKYLIKSGANVALCGRSSEKLKELVFELEEYEGNIFYQSFDISDYDRIVEFVLQAKAQIGEIEFLVNVAGVNSARAKVEAIDIADLEWMIKVNMIAPFVFMKEVYNQSMKPKGKGTIINVMSTVCQFSNEGIGAYTASKSGFDALTGVFRKEARVNGVKICGIYPGGVDSPFRESDRPDYLAIDDVVNSILYMINQSDNACIDELVVRPMVERNFT